MKKYLLILIAAFLVLTTNAQIPLYRGLISGMTMAQVQYHLYSSSDFTVGMSPTYEYKYTTEIEGWIYEMTLTYNKNNLLKSIIFWAKDEFETSDYLFNSMVGELYLLLREYGEPIHSISPSWTDTSTGDFAKNYEFAKETTFAMMFVNCYNKKYSIMLIIGDKQFSDPK